MLSIPYRFLNYEAYDRCLKEIIENTHNQFKVEEHEPIGFSTCGFPLRHYSIGNGPFEIVYMGGAHGNEIIGVDFIIHYMKNLALGNGVFSSFRPDLFRIHFFPIQNPEGFFTTTYAITEVCKDLDFEAFCKDYYRNYREANQAILGIHTILEAFCVEKQRNHSLNSWKEDFWSTYYGHNITVNQLREFLEEKLDDKIDNKYLEDLWNQYILSKVICCPWAYQRPFEGVDYQCIPEVSQSHQALRNHLKDMFSSYHYPKAMYANFCANAIGVNLNENNEPYFQEQKAIFQEGKQVMVAPIYGNFPKNIVGPFGMPSDGMETFSYAIENRAVLDFLKKHHERIYAFVNCHSTGGMLFFNPYYEKDNTECDFSFYINNRLATEYLKEIRRSFLRNGVDDSYQAMGYPNRVSGFGDVLRHTYPASFLLELSKAGGNPLGPYIHPNYELTMKVNMEASQSLWKTILEVQDLYGKTYRKYYDVLGRVRYEECVRTRKK